MTQLRLLSLCSIIVLAGCAEEKSYGACDDFTGFTQPVVPVASVAAVIPMGELNPPEDVVPGVAGGFKFNVTAVDVTAPGDGFITRVTSTEYLISPGRQGVTDFGLVFRVCDDIQVEFAHIVSLDDSLVAAMGSGNCEEHMGPEETIRDCTYSLDFAISAGDPIGSTGLYQNGEPTGLDFSATDQRVEAEWLNPSRIGDVEHYHHGICSYELFVPAIRDSYIALAASGLTPLVRDDFACGTAHVDYPDSAQGVWVREDNPVTLAEDLQADAPNFLTLSPDVAEPANLQVISPGVAALQTILVTTPREPSGRVNLDFAEVPSDGTIHCYEGVYVGQPEVHSFLLAVDGDGLTVERLVSECSMADPATWSFSGSAVAFIR